MGNGAAAEEACALGPGADDSIVTMPDRSEGLTAVGRKLRLSLAEARLAVWARVKLNERSPAPGLRVSSRAGMERGARDETGAGGSHHPEREGR